MFYQERRSNEKGAFALGLGIGVALTAAGIYAWKKFKETHPDFNIKDYCEKCGIISDECDFDCDSDCANCPDNAPEYDDSCDICDIEVDMPSDDDKQEEEESDDDSDDHRRSRGNITFNQAFAKVSKIALKLYNNCTVTYESEEKFSLTHNKTTADYYVFRIMRGNEFSALIYVNCATGEVFDNSEKEMKKIG